MPFTNAQKEKITTHLAQFPLYNKCVVCGQSSWNYCDELVVYQMLDIQYKMVIEGKLFPLVILTCNKCGYVVSFSAQKLELI